jgi:hypothetical protein
MLDINLFKRQVKEWIAKTPQGDSQALLDFCEAQIPPSQFTAYQWLVDQTMSWYTQMMERRKLGDPSEWESG